MKEHVVTVITVIIFGAVLLFGCASQKQTMIKQGYPESYADGFEDGCHSGKKAGGNLFEQFKKDVVRFNKDKNYAQGWSDGFRQCETEQEALDRQTRMSIEWQRMDNERKRSMEHEALKGLDTSGLKNLK
ncbi:MAG: hypothetical protein U9N83_02480 [Thermodesulfobacteriota bacterium]|nr:hypothetical protein [Thermodesulfobacteriota bacterium]